MEPLNKKQFERQLVRRFCNDFHAGYKKNKHNVRYNGKLLAYYKRDNAPVHEFHFLKQKQRSLFYISKFVECGFDSSCFEDLKINIVVTKTKPFLKITGNSVTPSLILYLRYTYHLGMKIYKEYSEQFQVYDKPESQLNLFLQLGGVESTMNFIQTIYHLLDYLYLGLHGDYAYSVAYWLSELDIQDPKKLKSFPEDIKHSQHQNLLKINQIIEKSQVWMRHQKPKGWYSPSWPLFSSNKVRREWFKDNYNGTKNKNVLIFCSEKKNQIGYTTNTFVIRRLNKMKLILKGKTNRTHASFFMIGSKKINIKINGGSYPFGGRKPPSITHGTTYALDIGSFSIMNIPKGSRKKVFEDLKEIYSLPYELEDDDLQQLGNSEFDEENYFAKEQYYRYLSTSFEVSVAITQSIILTLPSQIIYGDIFALIAAVGGLYDYYNSLNLDDEKKNEILRYIEQIKILYDPAIHYHHWHVDWIPDDAINVGEIDKNSIVPSKPGIYSGIVRNLKELKKRSRISIKTPSSGEIESVEKLMEWGKFNLDKQLLPVGNIDDDEFILKWVGIQMNTNQIGRIRLQKGF